MMDSQQINYLENIPEEVFLHICSFLDSRHLVPLSKVCRYFYKVLNDDFMWKSRIGGRWIPCNEGAIVSWQEACNAIEVEAPYLRTPPGYDHIIKTEAHNSDIHAVHILEGNELCLTGSRDQDLCVWRLTKEAPEQVCQLAGAHKGWVWRIASRGLQEIFTCSFDYYVKLWNLAPTGLQEVSSFKCGKAVMSIQLLPERHLIAAGLIQGIMLLDERLGDKPVHVFCPKSNNHLALTAFGPDLLVASGLKRTITTCDLRNHIEIDSDFSICEYPGHPQCMKVLEGKIYVGDTMGQLHMLDVTNGHPKRLQIYGLGQKENFLTMSGSYTSLITASSCGNIRFWRHQVPPKEWENPYRPLKQVGHLKLNQDELCSMHYRDGVLAAALSRHFALNYWLPK